MTLPTPEALARSAWMAMPPTLTVDDVNYDKQDWPDDEPNEDRVLFAECIRDAILDALIALSDKNALITGGGVDYLANNAQWTRVTYWLRDLKEDQP